MRFASHAHATAGVIVFAASVMAHAETPTSAATANAALASQSATAVVEIATTAASTEVPEPKQWVLLLAGLGVVGWVAQRRR